MDTANTITTSGVPRIWDIDVNARLDPLNIEAFRGETLHFIVRTRHGLRNIKPSPDSVARIFWRKKGTDGQFDEAEVTISEDFAEISAEFTPEMDEGHDAVEFFIGTISETTGRNYRPHGVITFKDSPGANPVPIPRPVPWLYAQDGKEVPLYLRSDLENVAEPLVVAGSEFSLRGLSALGPIRKIYLVDFSQTNIKQISCQWAICFQFGRIRFRSGMKLTYNAFSNGYEIYDWESPDTPWKEAIFDFTDCDVEFYAPGGVHSQLEASRSDLYSEHLPNKVILDGANPKNFTSKVLRRMALTTPDGKASYSRLSPGYRLPDGAGIGTPSNGGACVFGAMVGWHTIGFAGLEADAIPSRFLLGGEDVQRIYDIGDRTFNFCGSQISAIASYAFADYFQNSYNNAVFRFDLETPPTIGMNAIGDEYDTSRTTIYVPYDLVQTYKSAWPTWEDRIFAEP